MAVSPKEPTEISQVDLGDDLLAPAPSSGVAAAPRSSAEQTVHQDLDSARILLSEGLTVEARRTLFRVLRREPENPMARQLLEEIREIEVRALLESRGPARPTLTEIRLQPTTDGAAALARLDAELRLGLDTAAQERPLCEAWLEASLPEHASQREVVDWAVALIALGQPQLAAEVLERSPRLLRDIEIQLLHAEVLVLCGRARESLSVCEQALRDPEVSGDRRREFGYLRGRSLELLGRREEARSIFISLGDLRDSRMRAESEAPDTGEQG
jgi:hypothetical protein